MTGFRAGAVFESRDEMYEPGRRVRLCGDGSMDGVQGKWLVKTIRNPRRPKTVGKHTGISEATLRTKWREVEPTGLR